MHEAVSSLIQRNLKDFEPTFQITKDSYRRSENLPKYYQRQGCLYLVCLDVSDAGKGESSATIIGGLGICPFKGLPFSEKLGEIKDLVVDRGLRGQGVGGRLLQEGVHQAKEMGYTSLYLETSSDMILAQRLFTSQGFKPIEEVPFDQAKVKKDQDLQGFPCYYRIENL